MNILITGGTGFIGKNLITELLKNGHQIFVISRNTKSKDHGLPAAVHFIEGDLLNEAIRDDRLKSIEIVFHFLPQMMYAKH